MKYNKGMSLLEVILVIAIMAILVGTAVSGIGYIRFADTKKCAYDINSMLAKTRTEAMSRSSKPYFYIYKYNNNYYMLATAASPSSLVLDGSATKIGNSSMEIIVKDEAGNERSITGNDVSSNAVKIGFVKSTGAFETSYFYDEILIQGKTDYTIKLAKNTGKHYVAKD